MAAETLSFENFDINVAMDPHFQFTLLRLGKKKALQMILQHRNLNREVLIFNHDLIIACIMDDVEAVKGFLNDPDCFEHQTLKDFPPLFIASAMGNAEVVSILLKHEKVDVNQKFFHRLPDTPIYCYGTAFRIACYLGHLEVIKLFFSDERVDVNERDEDGFTGFHHVCYRNARPGTVEFFMKDARVDVNVQSTLGYSPLILVILDGREAIFNILVRYSKERGLDFNTPNNEGRTPFYYACVSNSRAVELMLNGDFEIDYNYGLGRGLSGFESACDLLLLVVNGNAGDAKSGILEKLVRDKRILYPEIVMDKSNEALWDLLLLGCSIEPSRFSKLKFTDYFRQNCKELGLLDTEDELSEKIKRLGAIHDMTQRWLTTDKEEKERVQTQLRIALEAN